MGTKPVECGQGDVRVRRKRKVLITKRLDAKKVKERAKGRWDRLLYDAGFELNELKGTHGRPCPKCDGDDRYAPFSDLKDRGAVHCRHCFTSGCDPRPGDGIASVQWIREIDFLPALKWIDEWLNEDDEDEKSRVQGEEI